MLVYRNAEGVAYTARESLGTPVLNLNLGNTDRLYMKVFV